MKDHDFKYKKVRKQKYRSLIYSNIHTCSSYFYYLCYVVYSQSVIMCKIKDLFRTTEIYVSFISVLVMFIVTDIKSVLYLLPCLVLFQSFLVLTRYVKLVGAKA